MSEQTRSALLKGGRRIIAGSLLVAATLCGGLASQASRDPGVKVPAVQHLTFEETP